MKHGKSGFLYPVTDPYMAAYYIKRLINNQKGNVNIGKVARETAMVRHDKKIIITELIITYCEIMK